ncbi:MAG: cytochrome c oxidase accessory protein CcoG, partial [Planctomycetota bacterium]|nr:cytochrome c oxidase accessory protein CcoG [Planctomycetota bacterium]
ISIFLAVFLITALLGRAWCGWACPQTVYLEFLYRPLERLIYGEHGGRAKEEVPVYKRGLKYVVFFLVSMHLAHTFLSYFIGPNVMFDWSFGNPANHPAAFAIVYSITALMMFDFGYFREQMCTLICPYARLQSALLDRDSLIIGYDEGRGEPRHKGKANDGNFAGDCIDCNLCVAACPTGIDIRDGLQLECIACTQCADACDAVMTKVKRPKGLIRFASQNTLSGDSRRFWRPRIVVYPIIVAIAFGSFLALLGNRATSEVVFRRVQSDVPVILEREVLQSVMLDLANNSDDSRNYSLHIEPPASSLIVELPTLRAFEKRVVQLPIKVPIDDFVDGKFVMSITIRDDGNLEETLSKTLFGPK